MTHSGVLAFSYLLLLPSLIAWSINSAGTSGISSPVGDSRVHSDGDIRLVRAVSSSQKTVTMRDIKFPPRIQLKFNYTPEEFLSHVYNV